jgi:hypothetical protein
MLMLVPWFTLGLEAARLATEADKVIGLRLRRLATCAPDTPIEAYRMVAEKQAAFVEAAFAAGLIVATGGGGHAAARKVVRGYRRHVRANSRRLSRRS